MCLMRFNGFKMQKIGHKKHKMDEFTDDERFFSYFICSTKQKTLSFICVIFHFLFLRVSPLPSAFISKHINIKKTIRSNHAVSKNSDTNTVKTG